MIPKSFPGRALVAIVSTIISITWAASLVIEFVPDGEWWRAPLALTVVVLTAVLTFAPLAQWAERALP